MSENASPFPITLEGEHPPAVWVIQPPRHRLWLHLFLLFATFLSTLVVGARICANFAAQHPVFSLDDDSIPLFPVEWLWQDPARLMHGLPFSLTLMFILLAHEMGHYFYSRHYRVYATLPYFIPFPSLIGTLGAFIRIKSPIPSREALLDIGIAGPIAGFIPSCAAVLTGLSLSHTTGPSLVSSNQIGFPLAFKAAAWILHIHQPLATLPLHPIAIAGWVGMFATAMNLLPGGQFDGGHILYSVFPRLHRLVSLLTVVALVPLSKYFWVGWLLWAAFLWLTHIHPPVMAETAISAKRKWIAVFGVAMLVLAFSPAPIKQSSGREVWPQVRQGGWELIYELRDGARRLLHRK
jgi:Zn-dependent protease